MNKTESVPTLMGDTPGHVDLLACECSAGLLEPRRVGDFSGSLCVPLAGILRGTPI